MTDWYGDWQDERHAVRFDARSQLDVRNLIRHYEAFNDVRLLTTRLDPSRPVALVEIGCATGEFYRYLRVRHPQVRYYGMDVSEPAVAKARAKYPDAVFLVTDPAAMPGDGWGRLGLPEHPEIVYAKDVLQHQTKPLEFLAALLDLAADSVILRCRTRDVGPTEWDPEKSCQYHYEGWMPYLIVNLQELIAHIHAQAPGCEVAVTRHHMVLGGQQGRFLPKDLYRKEAGTAETALGIFKRTDHPGRVLVEDQPDQPPACTWDFRLKRYARRAVAVLRRGRAAS